MNLHNPPGPDETAAASGPFRRIDELPGPRGLPFVGNLLQLKPGRVHTILNRWADEFGSLYKLRMR